MSELQYREYALFPFTHIRVIFVQIVTITASSVNASVPNDTKRPRNLQSDARVGSEGGQKCELRGSKRDNKNPYFGECISSKGKKAKHA